MILCKCGKAFASPTSVLDHLSTIALFCLDNSKMMKEHGIFWQDGGVLISKEGLAANIYNNLEYITSRMKGDVVCGMNEAGTQLLSFLPKEVVTDLPTTKRLPQKLTTNQKSLGSMRLWLKGKWKILMTRFTKRQTHS